MYTEYTNVCGNTLITLECSYLSCGRASGSDQDKCVLSEEQGEYEDGTSPENYIHGRDRR